MSEEHQHGLISKQNRVKLITSNKLRIQLVMNPVAKSFVLLKVVLLM